MAIVSLLKLPFLLPQSLDIEATDGVHFVSANRNANINDTDSSFGIVISPRFSFQTRYKFPFICDHSSSCLHVFALEGKRGEETSLLTWVQQLVISQCISPVFFLRSLDVIDDISDDNSYSFPMMIKSFDDHLSSSTQCLKITINVSVEFFNFGTFHPFLSF